MKRYGLLGALIGLVVAVLGFTQLPAIAQQIDVESAWEIYPTPYGDGHVLVVKHNGVTGQTLLLTCSGNCGGNEDWRDYSIAE